MNEKIKHFSLLTGSTLIMAVGTYFFKFTNNFTFGGITGLAVLVADKTNISASDFSFIVNMLLLALGFVVLGRKFAAKTAYCSILLSVALSFLSRVCPMEHPLTDQTMLELCFAIALPALGSAILFNIGSSSGGTDIIAMIIKRFASVDIGVALMITDALVAVSSFFVYGAETGLFSVAGLLAKTLVIDGVIENINLCKFFTIISENPEPIVKFIHEDLNRSATVYRAEGTYLHKDKTVILAVTKRRQAVLLRNFVKVTEPGAFLMITNSSEIIGKGFQGY